MAKLKLKKNSQKPELKKLLTLGPKGTYASIAVERCFKCENVEYFHAIRDVFLNIKTSGAALVPLENSIEGTVRESWDSIFENKLNLCAICRLKIDHSLGSHAKSLSQIKTVVSHPQAISQCRKFLQMKLPKAGIQFSESTAAGIESALKDPSIAVIASKETLEASGLKILKESIQDFSKNETVFGLVGKKDLVPEMEKDEMHIVITPKKNYPGLLFDILKPFKSFNLDLTKLESRPTGNKMGEYRFFISFKIENKMEAVNKMLKLMRVFYKIDIIGMSLNLN